MIALALATALAAAAPEETLFPAVDGWKLSGFATYSPENLYEYIDGAADAFLQLDFEELKTATYTNAEKVEVVVDVYRHRDPTRAFGMYAQERPGGYTPLPVGTEGYAGADHFELVAGPYYVKLTQSKGGATHLRPLAERVAAKLPGPRGAPKVLECFPEKGKRARAERLAVKDFLGHPFLHDGFTAPYEIDGVRFRLFAARGKDAADARAMVGRYLAAAHAAPAPAPGPEGWATVKDPLNGEVLVGWKGLWVFGAVDGSVKGQRAMVEELAKKLASLEP